LGNETEGFYKSAAGRFDVFDDRANLVGLFCWDDESIDIRCSSCSGIVNQKFVFSIECFTSEFAVKVVEGDAAYVGGGKSSSTCV
jgi:hypothetical protein